MKPPLIKGVNIVIEVDCLFLDGWPPMACPPSPYSPPPAPHLHTLHTLHRLHVNRSHVESLNLLKEAGRMLGVHLTYPKPSEEYTAGFLNQERRVLAAMAAYVAARPICTLWDLCCFLAKQQDQDSYEKLLVGAVGGALAQGNFAYRHLICL